MKLSSQEKQEYYIFESRMENLWALKLFLNLRREIKKHILENYSTLEILEFKPNYCDFGFAQLEGIDVSEHLLQPLIDEYVKKLIFEIESKTLDLFAV